MGTRRDVGVSPPRGASATPRRHLRLEGARGHELGDEDDAFLALEGGLPGVVEADDVGVLEPLQHLGLLLEALLLRLAQLAVLGRGGRVVMGCVWGRREKFGGFGGGECEGPKFGLIMRFWVFLALEEVRDQFDGPRFGVMTRFWVFLTLEGVEGQFEGATIALVMNLGVSLTLEVVQDQFEGPKFGSMVIFGSSWLWKKFEINLRDQPLG